MLTNDITNYLNQGTLSNPATAPTSTISKSGFLQLLVKQLSSQDPLNPMTNEEFVAQLAQFSSLEQQINLNDSFTQFLGFQQLTQASTLLGKKVICLVPSGDSYTPASGIVEQVLLVDNQAYLKLSTGDEVNLNTVVSVQAGGES
jgi:flagellar basal-body rod modification protein FlgD